MTPARRITPRCTRAPAGYAADAASGVQAAVPQLETERLILRAPKIDDLGAWTPAFMEAWAEPGDTEERAWEEFSYYAAGWILHGHGLWTVVRKSDGVVIGFVSLGLEWDDDEPELGYIIVTDHRRQGYAAEACAAARDHGLALLGAGAFVSYIAPKNAASNRIATKLGAVRDRAAEAALNEDIHIWRHGVASP